MQQSTKTSTNTARYVSDVRNRARIRLRMTEHHAATAEDERRGEDRQRNRAEDEQEVQATWPRMRKTPFLLLDSCCP